SCSAFSRSRFACSASRRPCSIRSRRSASIAATGLNANCQSRTRNTTKLVAAMTTWKMLIWNSGSPSAASRTASPPTAETSPSRAISATRSGALALDEDREEADDDRENAEAFREGREDDREAADLARSVRVPADGGGGQAGKDADADAGSDHAKCRKACADVLHSRDPSLNLSVCPGR